MPLVDPGRQGVRLGLLARLGGQGHGAARRPGRHRRVLRADPPVEPDRHGRAAAAVPEGETAESLGLTGEETFTSPASPASTTAPRRRRSHVTGRRRGVRRGRPHRHPRRGRLLPPRRDPAVRAAQPALTRQRLVCGFVTHHLHAGVAGPLAVFDSRNALCGGADRGETWRTCSPGRKVATMPTSNRRDRPDAGLGRKTAPARGDGCRIGGRTWNGPGSAGVHARCAGHRGSVLPTRRQRRLRRRPLRLPVAYDPRPTSSPARPPSPPRHAEPVQLQPRLRRADRSVDRSTGTQRPLEPGRRRADRHAAPRRSRRRTFTTVVRYDGVPRDAPRRLGLLPHRRRRARPRAAARRGHLVPGQRPPDRQGVVHDRDHGARGAWRRSRTACSRRSAPGRADHLDLGGRGADGVLPGHDGDRRVRRRRLPRGRPAVLGRVDPTCSSRVAAHRRPVRVVAGRRPVLQAAHPDDQRPRRGGELSFWVTAGHRAQLGLPLRRGAHRSGGRLDDAAGPQRPHQPGHRLRLPVLVRSAPVPRALPDADRRRRDPDGHDGRMVGRERAGHGYEQWTVDLSAYAGRDVEVSISYASDDLFQVNGACSSTTSSSRPARAPPRSRTTATTWTAGRSRRAAGQRAQPQRLDRRHGATTPAAAGRSPQPRWTPAGDHRVPGGILRPVPVLGRRRHRRRPRRAGLRARDPDPAGLLVGVLHRHGSGDSVVVHEIAHQWVGDYLAVEQWQHIWLNEGFATYAEWLWSEREGFGTAQEIFDFYDSVFPADDPFWTVTIGDPGPRTCSTSPSTSAAR